MKKKEDMLKEKELDEREETASITTEEEERAEEKGADRPEAARNITDSGQAEPDGKGGTGEPDRQEKISSDSEKPSKGAKKTSRKELLGLISKKNEMLQKMEKETERLQEELKTKEDKLLRIAAEFENYKKRTRREWDLLEQRSKAELITDILGVLDDFDRALEALGERDDHVADGVVLIVTGLKDILKKAGLREIEALGERFDPQHHEAVGGIESEELEEGLVAHVVQKGYEMNEQLLRPAKVIVTKKK